jgi:hypothetical protein
MSEKHREETAEFKLVKQMQLPVAGLRIHSLAPLDDRQTTLPERTRTDQRAACGRLSPRTGSRIRDARTGV